MGTFSKGNVLQRCLAVLCGSFIFFMVRFSVSVFFTLPIAVARCVAPLQSFGSVEKPWGNKFFTTKDYCELCVMENDYLQMLAQIVLPSQILDYFTIAGVEQTATEIHIRLDEKMNPELSDDVHFESKGFMDAVNVTDFPIRDHKVILRIRRRRGQTLARARASAFRLTSMS